MLRASCDENEIYIEGDREGLEKIMAVLIAPEKFSAIGVSNPAPVSEGQCIEKIIVEKNDKRVIISRQHSKLLIAGKQDFLDIIAGNIGFLLDNKEQNRSDHLHEEYYEGHFYYHPESLPVVITFIKTL